MKTIIVRLMGLVALSLALVACGDKGPAEVTRAFVDEMVARDVEGAMEYATVESQILLGMADLFDKKPFPAKFDFELRQEQINGNEAKVKFRDKLTGKNHHVRLRQIEGEWKVHLGKY